MRFKKGSKVEVLSKKEVPSGAWRRAQIICGNGHNYTVQYDGYAGATCEKERVSRKAIRPCPPQSEVPENWPLGDVVEVFDNLSWKMAKVSKILGKNYVSVRLLGSSLEVKASKFDIRVRQSWQDDEWVTIGKVQGSRSCEFGKHDEILTLKYNPKMSSQVQKTNGRINLDVKNNQTPAENEVDFQESRISSSKNLKRGCYLFEASAVSAQKFRAIEKDNRLDWVMAAGLATLPKQVDAVAFPRERIAEKYMHASINNRKTGFSEVDVERRKKTGAVGCSFAEILESNDADRLTCSVGSCSINSNDFNEFPHQVLSGPAEDLDGHFSDAESFCGSGYEEGNCLLPTKEELAAEIHRLELHAYRCTIEALHASGPLSWEQEALVTNLRLSLHISNDEHLMELRNLVSTDNSIPTR